MLNNNVDKMLDKIFDKEMKSGWDKQTLFKTRIFLMKTVVEYSNKLGFSKDEILHALESRRDYCIVNYYQEAKFPSLDDIKVYDTQVQLKHDIGNKGFRCPSCNGVSKNPYTCNSGELMDAENVCDWKSYGFLGTLGKGFIFTVKEGFLEKAIIDQCFMPISLEAVNNEPTN